MSLLPGLEGTLSLYCLAWRGPCLPIAWPEGDPVSLLPALSLLETISKCSIKTNKQQTNKKPLLVVTAFLLSTLSLSAHPRLALRHWSLAVGRRS